MTMISIARSLSSQAAIQVSNYSPSFRLLKLVLLQACSGIRGMHASEAHITIRKAHCSNPHVQVLVRGLPFT
jgi:hypothetical protein